MEKRIPRMRFKEFIGSGEWEEKKLGEVANYRRGSFPQPYGKKEWYDGEGSKPFVQVIDVNNNLELVDKTKQKISILAQPKSVFVKKGTVIVTLQGSIGRVAITQYDSYLDRTILIFESYNEKIEKVFWAYVIQKKFREEKESAPGATIKTITIAELSKFIVNIPSYKEQEKIGNFFQKLDRMIDINRKKLGKIKASKSAYLTEMFPREGEDRPRRRFKGFTGPWEEKKLGEVSIAIGDGLHGTPKYSDEGTLYFINGNNLVNGEIVVTKSTKKVRKELDSNKKIYENSTIFMSINGTIGNLAFYNGEKIMLGKSVSYITVNTINITFLFFTLQTRTITKYFNSNLTGSTIKNLGLGIIRNTRIKIPSLAEQEKIGNFFKKLDDQIEVQEKKLEKLEKMKKAYLAEMFV